MSDTNNTLIFGITILNPFAMASSMSAPIVLRLLSSVSISRSSSASLENVLSSLVKWNNVSPKKIRLFPVPGLIILLL